MPDTQSSRARPSLSHSPGTVTSCRPVSGVISQHNLSPTEPNSRINPLWGRSESPKSALPSVLPFSVSPYNFQAQILRTTLNSFPCPLTFKPSASPSNPISRMSQTSPPPRITTACLNQDAGAQTLALASPLPLLLSNPFTPPRLIFEKFRSSA